MKNIESLPDYTLAAQELAVLWPSTKLDCAIKGGQPETDETGWKHSHYQLEFKRQGIAMLPVVFDWQQGVRCKEKPNPAEVLARCCAECLEAESCSFEEWAGNLGYDTDSRKAESIYLQCQSHRRLLTDLALTQKQIQTLADLSNRL